MYETDIKCPACGKYIWGSPEGHYCDDGVIFEPWHGECDCGKHYEWIDIFTFEQRDGFWEVMNADEE